jgi:tellurite resistance-related uncharacterized protein
MRELPDHIQAYKRSPTFTEISVPAGLLKAHSTKPGSWGKIVVLEGQLRYRILEPVLEEVVLSAEKHGVVEPTVPHEVEPLGAVSFYVEFYR